MIKASDIIKASYCGNLIDVDKENLIKMVEALEDENVLLQHQLNNAIAEIQKRGSR